MRLSHERMKIREAAASFVSKEYRRNYQEHASITEKQDIEKAVKMLNGIRTFRYGEYFQGRTQMKLLYGMGNPAKLSSMKRIVKKLGIELIGLRDLNCEIPDVPETGRTPLENARQKALAYYHAFHIPVFSCDSGLYFDGIPDDIQPGVHVRTIAGKRLTDGEMIANYSDLARRYGDLTARYKNAICLVLDGEQIYEAMEPSMESNVFILTDKPRSVLKEGVPLDSLSIDIKSVKYFCDLVHHESETSVMEEAFLNFFRRILSHR